MSSFDKDKKQLNGEITINSIEDNKESELNIKSSVDPNFASINPSPSSVVVKEDALNENFNTNVVKLNVANATDNIDDNQASNELKSEELLDIVLNADINSSIYQDNISNVQENNQLDKITDTKKLKKKINTFSKNSNVKTKEIVPKKTDKIKVNKQVKHNLNVKNDQSINNKKSQVHVSVKESSNKSAKIQNTKEIKSFKARLENGRKYLKYAADNFRDYHLPKVVTNALFLIVLMIVACICLIISINNRSNRQVSNSIIKKTYISPIYEGQVSRSLGAFSQSSIDMVAGPIDIIQDNKESSKQILNEIAQLQNAVSEGIGANALTDSALQSNSSNSEEINKDKEQYNKERLDYLLKSYVIISPSVDASVNQVFSDYFDSRMNVDIEKYLGLFGYDTSKVNVESFSGLKKTFEYERSMIAMITNVKVYICGGFETNEKICFVNYDMLLRYANVLVPSVFYANLVMDGNRYIIKPELDTYRQIYIDHIIRHDEIKSLNYNVQTKLNKVLNSNDFARLVYVSLRDKQIKIENQKAQDNDEYGSYIIQKPGGVFSTYEPVNKIVLNDLRSQLPYDSIPSYHGLLTDPLLR